MRVDKNYCMSSYLAFRFIYDEEVTFKEGIKHINYKLPEYRYPCKSSDDIDAAIQDYFKKNVDSKTGILLSGGMDSAILATYLPKGTKAYTLKSMVDGAKDESELAKYYADICGLEHHIVEIYWDDYEKLTPILMKQKGAPVHSIEPMIYKAALQAKSDGCTKLVSGESADGLFGGLDGLLSKDWTFEEFIERFTYLDPKRVLKEPVEVIEPYQAYFHDGKYDAYGFVSEQFYYESINSYLNACACAGVEFIAPFNRMKLTVPIDLSRIRNGESKYLIRELFAKRYPNAKPAVKLPMPRGVGQWLADWKGPVRDEFIPGCIEGLKGDQKWQLYCLEMFLNMMDNGEI